MNIKYQIGAYNGHPDFPKGQTLYWPFGNIRFDNSDDAFEFISKQNNSKFCKIVPVDLDLP